jgi:hypothetical protein
MYDAEADIRIITGPQGSGKSMTGVAYPVDDYFEKAKAIFPSGKQYPIVRTFPYYLCKTDDERILRLPPDFRARGIRIESPVKIFANFKLFGIKFVYTDLTMMIQNMNSPLISDAWFLIDESFMIDKRNSMTQIGKIVAQFGATIRKRRLHLLIMVQYKSMAELRLRVFATQTILCEYDKRTGYVTLTISKKGEKRKQTVSYNSIQYRRYYDTYELIPIPEHVIEKAKALVGAE